jgi:hypothetical protein
VRERLDERRRSALGDVGGQLVRRGRTAEDVAVGKVVLLVLRDRADVEE